MTGTIEHAVRLETSYVLMAEEMLTPTSIFRVRDSTSKFLGSRAEHGYSITVKQ